MAEQNKRMRIAIDGPAGAGKSTVAREVANRLKLKYLDTGAMYRAITLKVHRTATDLDNHDALANLLTHTKIKIDQDNRVFLDGEDVTDEIRMAHVNSLVSPVSCISQVRRHLVVLQQKIADQSGRIIMEGRDIASRVMPDADYKIYLDASIEERARRRSLEMTAKGHEVDIKQVEEEIRSRDKIDSNRADSPLTLVDDAIIIDTTGMTFDEVVAQIVNEVTTGVAE